MGSFLVRCGTACARAGSTGDAATSCSTSTACRNVEVGVLLDQPCPLIGRVVASALPAGTAAMTVHRGPLGDAGAAHGAVLDWCAAHGYRPDGTSWEVYALHDDDPGQQWTSVYWLPS